MRFPALLSLFALAACGGSSGDGSNNSTVAILTITPAGISSPTGSATVSVPTPGNVKFSNGDTVSHNIMLSTASTQSPDCNPLNVGAIAAGASSAQVTLTNNSTANEICSFVDASNPSAAFAGQITILTTNTGGSGY